MNKKLSNIIGTVAVIAATSVGVEARGPIPGVTSDTNFTIYYGDDYYTNTAGNESNPSAWQINWSLINDLRNFDVIVLQPNQPHCTPEIIEILKTDGVNDYADHVLGYISIGEDFIDDSVETPHQGAGMVALQGNDLLPTVGNTLASFYVDVDTQSVVRDAAGRVTSVTTTARLTPDSLPDYNPFFLGYIVNPDGDWRYVINEMRIGGSSLLPGRTSRAGLKQLVLSSSGDLRERTGNFGFDGFFLDTIDTAGPYDGAGWYPWTIDEMRDTVQFISDTYTDKVIVANRGAFYYSAGLQSVITGQYPSEFSIRPYVNGFLFESFRYDSNASTTGITPFYNENRYNLLPKIIAEANREDGFTPLSLEYEEGRPNIVQDAFNVDVLECGFTAYMSSTGSLNTVDYDFLFKLPAADNFPPTWDSTGHLDNTVNNNFRIGAQRVFDGPNSGEVVVQWDTAIDQSYPITYDIVVKNLSNNNETTFTNVPFKANPDWYQNPVDNLPNQVTVTGLIPATAYNFRVFARDAKNLVNSQDPGVIFTLGTGGYTNISNPVSNTYFTIDGQLNDWTGLAGYPVDPDDQLGSDASGNQANWSSIKVANSSDTLYMAYENHTPIYISWGFQILIDTDENPNTGLTVFAGEYLSIGADYLIEGVNIWRYVGTGGANWSWVKSEAAGGYEMGRIWSGNGGEVFCPLSWLGNPSSFKFVCFGQNQFYTGQIGQYDWYPDYAPSGGSFRYEVQ